MREIDKKAVEAAKNERVFLDFAEAQRGFLKKCASRTTKRYITDSDDEWSITLMAFTEAVKSYALEKGSFLSYAEMLIKHRLIDYYRAEKKHACEYSVSPDIFETESNEDNENLHLKMALAEHLAEQKDYIIKEEIESVNTELRKFGFSFFDLAECSPKSTKTKNACKQAVLYILENKTVIKEIYETKQLPIKIIQKILTYPEN